MTQIPWKLFDKYHSKICPQPGVGMVFFPLDPEHCTAIKEMIKDVCKRNELGFLGWREVPINNDALGPLAKAIVPSIWQFFVKAPMRLRNDDEGHDGFDRTL
eukprot:720705-Ditylum_brightwellii.AAC.2